MRDDIYRGCDRGIVKSWICTHWYQVAASLKAVVATLGGDLGPLGLCVVFGSWKQGSHVVDAFVWRALGNPAATAGGIIGLGKEVVTRLVDVEDCSGGRASETGARSLEDWKKKKLRGRIGHGNNGCENAELSVIEVLRRWICAAGLFGTKRESGLSK